MDSSQEDWFSVSLVSVLFKYRDPTYSSTSATVFTPSTVESKSSETPRAPISPTETNETTEQPTAPVDKNEQELSASTANTKDSSNKMPGNSNTDSNNNSSNNNNNNNNNNNGDNDVNGEDEDEVSEPSSPSPIVTMERIDDLILSPDVETPLKQSAASIDFSKKDEKNTSAENFDENRNKSESAATTVPSISNNDDLPRDKDVFVNVQSPAHTTSDSSRSTSPTSPSGETKSDAKRHTGRARSNALKLASKDLASLPTVPKSLRLFGEGELELTKFLGTVLHVPSIETMYSIRVQFRVKSKVTGGKFIETIEHLNGKEVYTTDLGNLEPYKNPNEKTEDGRVYTVLVPEKQVMKKKMSRTKVNLRMIDSKYRILWQYSFIYSVQNLKVDPATGTLLRRASIMNLPSFASSSRLSRRFSFAAFSGLRNIRTDADSASRSPTSSTTSDNSLNRTSSSRDSLYRKVVTKSRSFSKIIGLGRNSGDKQQD
jgi:hypothetical protein